MDNPKEKIPDIGIRMTVEAMISESLKGGSDPWVKENAGSIVSAAWPPGLRSWLKPMKAIFSYAQGTHPTLGGLRFSMNPVTAELVGSPQLTQERGGGDADELAVWLAAHLIALGHRDLRFVLAAFHPDAEFCHVFVQVRVPDKDFWLSLDPTRPEPMGYQVPAMRLGFVPIAS